MYCICCGLTCCCWCRLCCCCWWWWNCWSLRSPGCSCCKTRLCWLLLCICTAACCPFPWANAGTNNHRQIVNPMLNIVLNSPAVKKYGTLVYSGTIWTEYGYWTKEMENKGRTFLAVAVRSGWGAHFHRSYRVGQWQYIAVGCFWPLPWSNGGFRRANRICYSEEKNNRTQTRQ